MSPISRLSQSQIEKFLTFKSGEDFGAIVGTLALSLKVPAAPIRLQFGIPGPKGYGYSHIKDAAGRLEQLRRLGYATVEVFIFDVAQHFQKVGDGKDGRLALIYRKNGYDLQVIIQYNPKGYWSVTTGLPYRESRCRILQVVVREDGCETPSKAAEPSRFETLTLSKG